MAGFRLIQSMVYLPGFDGPAPLATFFVGTRHGYLLRVTARSRREAVAAVDAEHYGPALDVQTADEYRRRNAAAHAAYCRHCGEPKRICGGWCVVDPID